jgi:hypothetical protein
VESFIPGLLFTRYKWSLFGRVGASSSSPGTNALICTEQKIPGTNALICTGQKIAGANEKSTRGQIIINSLVVLFRPTTIFGLNLLKSMMLN